MNQDNYNFINGFNIKKPGNNCQPDSIKHYEWFVKKLKIHQN